MRASIGITLGNFSSPEIVALAREVERYVNDLRAQPAPLPSMTVADLLLLDPADWTDCAAIVSNETGGRTIATSDGAAWRRTRDGAVIT